MTSPDCRHVPTGRLAILAQRLGLVFLSVTTWYRLVRERGWRRPRLRVHPQGPKVGIRATKPHEIGNTDTRVIRLRHGSRAYLHAVIDNAARRILARKLVDHLDPGGSVEVLVAAGRRFAERAAAPRLLADAGIENNNRSIDELLATGLFHRVIAMTEIRFANSMIEAWWRVLEHSWLCLHPLDSVAKVRRLVEFHVHEHDTRVPHAAFEGQTPDEMYFGTEPLPDGGGREAQRVRAIGLQGVPAKPVRPTPWAREPGGRLPGPGRARWACRVLDGNPWNVVVVSSAAERTPILSA